VVRALVKKVEVDEQEIRIVYRVSPSHFERGPQQSRSQHCWGRVSTLMGQTLSSTCAVFWAASAVA
jgi:site-specific DNA recombinase